MPNNYIKLQVQNSGQYLSAPVSDNSNGTSATQEPVPTSINSSWELEDAPGNPGWFLLKVRSSGLYLNIANSGMNNGDPAKLNSLPSPVTDNFLWQKSNVPGSTLWSMFKVKHSGQFLNIYGLSKQPGVYACQGQWNSTPNFYWLEQPDNQWNKRITINLQIDCPDLIRQMPNGGVISDAIANTDLVFSDDNNGKRKNGSNNQKDFESIVNPGNTVVWTASTKSGNTSQYSVGIDSIVYDAGSGTGNIFSESTESGDSGRVTAEVLWAALPPAGDGDNENYTVNFTVTPKNGTPIQYSIDPKLKVNPTTVEDR